MLAQMESTTLILASLDLVLNHASRRQRGEQRGTSRRWDVLDTSFRLRRSSDYSIEQGARFEVHIAAASAATTTGIMDAHAAHPYVEITNVTCPKGCGCPSPAVGRKCRLRYMLTDAGIDLERDNVLVGRRAFADETAVSRL
jgi:hypothetical protein